MTACQIVKELLPTLMSPSTALKHLRSPLVQVIVFFFIMVLLAGPPPSDGRCTLPWC